MQAADVLVPFYGELEELYGERDLAAVLNKIPNVRAAAHSREFDLSQATTASALAFLYRANLLNGAVVRTLAERDQHNATRVESIFAEIRRGRDRSMLRMRLARTRREEAWRPLPEARMRPAEFFPRTLAGQDAIEQIQHSFGALSAQLARSAEPERAAVVLLAGERGMGRSRIASRYAELHRSRYRWISWLSLSEVAVGALDPAPLLERLIVDEVRRLELVPSRTEADGAPPPDAAAGARDAALCDRFLDNLDAFEGPVLLVYDGVADHREIRGLLPRSSAVHVLITGPVEIASDPAPDDLRVLQVTDMRGSEAERASAVEMVLRGFYGRHAWEPSERDAARALCEIAGYRPLLLAVLGAMVGRGTPPSLLLASARAAPGAAVGGLLERAAVAQDDVPRLGLLRLILSNLEGQESTRQAAAALRAMAWLAADVPIPLSLIQRIAELPVSGDGLGLDAAGEAVADLARLSLVAMAGARAAVIHPMIQGAAQQWLLDRDPAVLKRTLRALRVAPEQADDALLQHQVAALLHAASQPECLEVEDLDRAIALVQILRTRRWLGAARALAERLSAAVAGLAAVVEQRAGLLRLCGAVSMDQGEDARRWGLAQAEEAGALLDARSAEGPGEARARLAFARAQTALTCAQLLNRFNRPRAAEAERAARVGLEALERAEPDAAAAQLQALLGLELASSLNRQGRFDEAIGAGERALAAFPAALEAARPRFTMLLAVEHARALADRMRDRPDEGDAADLAARLDRAWRDGSQVLGADHPEIASLEAYLAEALMWRGALDEALGRARQAVDRLQRAGPRRGAALSTREDLRLATALWVKGRVLRRLAARRPDAAALAEARADLALAASLVIDERPPSMIALRIRGDAAMEAKDLDALLMVMDHLTTYYFGSAYSLAVAERLAALQRDGENGVRAVESS